MTVLRSLLAGVALLLLVAGPAAAECDGPIPPLADAVPTAQRVLIGTVVSVVPGTANAQGRSPRFTLRVSDVLRGPRVSTLEVRDLEFLPCGPDYVAAAPGEVIALAINARGFEPVRTYSTYAWIKSVSELPADYPRTTRAQVLALAGAAPETDTAAAPAANGDPWPAGSVALTLAAALGVALWFRRTGRPPLPSPRRAPRG